MIYGVHAHTLLARVSQCWICVCAVYESPHSASILFSFVSNNNNNNSITANARRLVQCSSRLSVVVNAHVLMLTTKRRPNCLRFLYFSLNLDFPPSTRPMFDPVDSMACRVSAEITHKYLSNVNYTLTLFHGACVPAAAAVSGLAFTSHVFLVAIPLGVSITRLHEDGTEPMKQNEWNTAAACSV